MMNKKIILPVFIGMILFTNTALAIPGVPNQFYGSVTYNGQPASDGLTVTAKINGVAVVSTTTSEGKYGYTPVFYVEDPNNIRSGDTIQFFVNGINTGETAIFCNGCVTILDLSVSYSPPSGDGGSNDNGSGGGGSGGGGSYTPPIEEEEEEVQTEEVSEEKCEEKWVCIEWSGCENEIETRMCTDENECGTDLHKPMESQPCSKIEMESEKEFDMFTGFASLEKTHLGIGLTFVAIIAIIIFIFKKPF